MLAYVFWHRPAADVSRAEYEAALQVFHASLDGIPSNTFALDELPFGEPGRGGYEDWYLVPDWAALGELNATAVDAAHKVPHDDAAMLAAEGWGGVYRMVTENVPGEPPRAVSWSARRPQATGDGVLWQRQTVLGPAPEYCLAAVGPARRALV